MKTNKNIFKHIWILSVIFVNYLLIGSFFVDRSLYDLIYLIIFDTFNIIIMLDRNYEEGSSD